MSPGKGGEGGAARVGAGGADSRVKRAIDLVGASLGLLLSLPVLAAAALLIRLTSRGPALYWQRRCGRGGVGFDMPKLRTMVVGADARLEALRPFNLIEGPAFKMRNDPRITAVGRFLRRHSLDELPQLWCVLRGEMSLVGPRPPLPAEVARYDARELRRLSVRPGITGVWQVSRHEGMPFAQWLLLDEDYIDNWSPGRDLRILLATIPVVLRGENL